MSSVDSLHECLGELELRRRGKGRRRSRPPRCSSPEGGAPAKEREMVRRSRFGRSVGLAGSSCVRARARSLHRGLFLGLPAPGCVLSSKLVLFPTAARFSLPPLPHPTESLPAVSYPSLLLRSYFVACTHYSGLCILLYPADSLIQHTTC